MDVYICSQTYIHICKRTYKYEHGQICNDCYVFAEVGNIFDFLRVHLWACLIPQEKNILVSPIVCVTTELTVVSSWNCPRATLHDFWNQLQTLLLYNQFVAENMISLLVDTSFLLLATERFCKVIYRMFTVMRSHMTITSNFGLNNCNSYVINMFSLQHVLYKILFPKCSLHTGVFDWLCFKCFTTSADEFLRSWSIYRHLIRAPRGYH